MNIESFKKNNNFEILKENDLSLQIEVLNINIFYKTIVSLSVFEKFIIKIIEKAKNNNISLVDTFNEEVKVNIEKISEILSLDNEIIEENIAKLSKAGLIEIYDKKLLVKWDENLKNWEKELIEEERKELYFKDINSIESFNNLAIEEQSKFLHNRYSNNKKTFHNFEIEKQEMKEVTLRSFILLDKDSFELKVIFEKDNKLLTLSEEITTYDAIQKLSNQELIIIENDKIKNDVEIRFSEEQLDVINSKDKYILLKARAGSGKTAVITERTKRLLKEGINTNQILLLAFNKKASIEMNERVKNNFKNAKTFHSFAFSIVQPIENILQDKGLSTFVQKIIQENNNSDNLKNYLDIDTEIKDEFEKLRLTLSKKDFVQYIRENKTLTFKGLNIQSEHKSNGEKYISDFLFEHDIEFEYEKKFDWDSKIYKPDFTIFANTNNSKSPYIILEHWGIDENKKYGQVPKNWTKSYQEYKNEMERKREFWKNKNEVLIETSITDFNFDKQSKISGKETFQLRLKEKLENEGVLLNKLSDEEIYEKLEFQNILKITKQVEQYISHAKQAKFSPQILQKKIEDFRKDKRTYYFLIFANYIFRLYEEEKSYKDLIDFNDMLIKAINQMKEYQVSKLKYIMIDEFQDFSPLFFDLIEKIKSFNSDVNILAVGDDWQGINGFAGANLKYFKNFKNYFESSIEKSMLVNYRSPNKIVEFSNKILEGEKSKANTSGGQIFYNQTYNQEFLEEIISQNPNKKIVVIVRTNDEKEKIKGIIFETAHKSKGLQYDIVIIKDASSFDYLHPDNKLSEIFNKTEKDFIEENKRLFYVAVTRAKDKLYICRENSFFNSQNRIMNPKN